MAHPASFIKLRIRLCTIVQLANWNWPMGPRRTRIKRINLLSRGALPPPRHHLSSSRSPTFLLFSLSLLYHRHSFLLLSAFVPPSTTRFRTIVCTPFALVDVPPSGRTEALHQIAITIHRIKEPKITRMSFLAARAQLKANKTPPSYYPGRLGSRFGHLVCFVNSLGQS